MVRVNISLPGPQFQRLQTVAASQGIKPGTWAKRAVIIALSKELPQVKQSESLDMFETVDGGEVRQPKKRKGGRK